MPSQLLAVVGWPVEHPRPGIYLRQVDLPGVHSKFMEAHRGVLAELLDWVLPVDAVEITKAGVSPFAGRFGFLDKPRHIRFRVFDPVIQALPSSVCPDVTLDAHASVWGAENKPRRVNLHRLTPQASALYDELRDHHICADAGLGAGTHEFPLAAQSPPESPQRQWRYQSLRLVNGP